jgi:hypothetical protein
MAETLPPPPVAKVVLAPGLAGVGLLVRLVDARAEPPLVGTLVFDRWNWVYAAEGGGLSVLPDRSDILATLGRVYLEGPVIVAWEPAGG